MISSLSFTFVQINIYIAASALIFYHEPSLYSATILSLNKIAESRFVFVLFLICEWGLGCTLSVAISLWFWFEFILCLLYQGLRSDAIHSTKEIKYMEWNYKTPHSNSLIWTSLFHDWELISVGLKFSLMFLQIYAGQSIIITQKHLHSDVYS